MRQTIVLTYEPLAGCFSVTANSARILRDATFAESVSHMAKVIKQAQGDKAPEGLDAFILKEAEAEQNGGAALPIPEPVPLKDAVGTVVETEKSPEQTAWESGTEKHHTGSELLLDRNLQAVVNEEPDETMPATDPEPEAPVETQPEQQPEKIPVDSPATVHDTAKQEEEELALPAV